MIKADPIVSFSLLGVLLVCLFIWLSKESKRQHEQNFKRYRRTDRGWTDDIGGATWNPADYDIVEIDERSGEASLLYKGRLSNDPREPKYTFDDLEDYERYSFMQFSDGLRIGETEVSKEFHTYFDMDFAYCTIEERTEKWFIPNERPQQDEIERHDIVDIRHLNKEMNFMVFRKGRCPLKWREHLVTGLDSRGVITAATQRGATRKALFSGWYED